MCKLNRILAPFVPFTSEVIYQNLERQFDSNSADSVHLCHWVSAEPANRDLSLENMMAVTRKVVSAARALRNEGGIRVRQPLPEVIVAGLDYDLDLNYIALIKDELNVKSVSQTSDSNELFSYSAKANFKTLGPKVGAGMKEMATAISSLNMNQIIDLSKGGELTINGVTLIGDDLILIQKPSDGYWVRNVDDLTIAVAYTVDKQLKQEWLAREFVHHVQNLRRSADLKVTQRIKITYSSNSDLSGVLTTHQKYICNETLAVLIAEEDKIEHGDEVAVGEIKFNLTISAMN